MKCSSFNISLRGHHLKPQRLDTFQIWNLCLESISKKEKKKKKKEIIAIYFHGYKARLNYFNGYRIYLPKYYSSITIASQIFCDNFSCDPQTYSCEWRGWIILALSTVNCPFLQMRSCLMKTRNSWEQFFNIYFTTKFKYCVNFIRNRQAVFQCIVWG